MKSIKISIIGTGMVGSSIAYALMLRNVDADIYLVDANEVRCRGEILDLSDAQAFCGSGTIKNGTLKSAGQSDIIIISAGKRQEPGQDRITLQTDNIKIIQSIIENMKPIKKDAVIIMVSNPLDILTLQAQKLSGLPRSQVFGTGTFLDTHRMREHIAQLLSISIQSIHAYVIGEHGDTQFPAWSSARIAGRPLSSFSQLSRKELDVIAQKTRDKAYEIISCKGATYWGIATATAFICNSIINDEKRITPLSCYQEEYGVCLSMPTVLGRSGISQILPIELDADENKKLEKSVAALKSYLK